MLWSFFPLTIASIGEVGSLAMLTCFSQFKGSKRRKIILFILCLINWRAEFEEGEEKSLQCNPHQFCLSKETACGPLSTTFTQATFQTSSFRTTCLCSNSHEKKVSFKLPLGEVEQQEKLHCVIPMWWAWGTQMLRDPRGRGRAAQTSTTCWPRHFRRGSWWKGGRSTDEWGRRTPLTSPNWRIKNRLYRKYMCLWAHRSFCCLAALVGIYCLPLQFSKKLSKLLHAPALTFQSMNTTSYLPGKAEFRTSTSYKKTWTGKAFPSIQPHTRETNHTALVLWTLRSNSKVCMKSYHHQTMRSSTSLCLKVSFLIHQISAHCNKPWQPPLSLLQQQYKTRSKLHSKWATRHHYQAQGGTRRWCFSFRKGPSSCWFPAILI